MPKTAVLIAALLFFPLVIAATAGGMLYAARGRADRDPLARERLRGFAVVGGLVAAAAVLVPLLILWRTF